MLFINDFSGFSKKFLHHPYYQLLIQPSDYPIYPEAAYVPNVCKNNVHSFMNWVPKFHWTNNHEDTSIIA